MPSTEHEQLVEAILANPTSADASLAELRAGFDAFLAAQAIPDDVEVTALNAGGVAVDGVTVPGSDPDRVVLYLHGGGYAMGSAAGYRAFAARLARQIMGRVLVVDYRLAPEARHPAASDDCLAAWNWLLSEGASAGQVVIAADSGAVGLMLAVLRRIVEGDGEVPAGAVAFCPWIDLAVGETIADVADVDDPISTREGLRYFAGLYLDGHAATDPDVNALRGELRGLPPLLVAPGTRDIAYGDALRLVALARQAGVPTTVRTFHGCVHNFQLAAHLPEAGEAVESAAEFIAQRLAGPVSIKEGSR